MTLFPFSVPSVLYSVFYCLFLSGYAFAASSVENAGSAPDDVQQSVDGLAQQIQMLQQRQALLLAGDSTVPESLPTSEQCPRKVGTYSGEFDSLQSVEKSTRNELKQLNEQLGLIKLGMYTRVVEQKTMCLETTAVNLLPIIEAADQLDTNARLRKVDHLLLCIDNSMIKINNKISAASASNNTMKVVKLNGTRDRLANFRSIATTLSQQFAVHENKRLRLLNDADENTINCEESEDL